MRKLLVVATGALLTLGLAGCVVFQTPPTAAQLDLIGKIRVAFTICASNTDEANNPGCPNTGNTQDSAPAGSSGQVLVAFRVPAGSQGPDAFSQTSGEALTFTRSPSYEAALEQARPAGEGRKWVGYISGVYDYTDPPDGTAARSAGFEVDFSLPDGAPFAGPFRVRPVVGARRVDEASGLSASDPVSCGSRPAGGSGGSFANNDVICIDDPDEATLATDIEVATADLAIVGGTATVNPGVTATVPFDAKLAGELPPGTTFALAGTTSFPGAAATPGPSAIAPGPNSTTRVNVPIAVPPTAGPGIYSVGLTATLPNGQSRAGAATLTVRDKQKPRATRLAVRPKVLRPSAPSVARVGSAVTYRLSETATMRFRVQRCVKRKKSKRTRCRTMRGRFTHSGVAGVNRFNFTGFLRDRALRRGRYRLIAVPVDPARNRGRAVRAGFRVKR